MIERYPLEHPGALHPLRKDDITASRVGALFDVHPYCSALRLYLEKSGVEFPEQDDSPVKRRGRLLEGAVGLAVAEARPDWRIVKAGDYFRDADARLGATPDFFIEGDPRGPGVLQTKTVAPHVFKRDWEEGQTIPFWITLQTLAECMLTGAAWGAVAAMKIDAFDLACPILDVPRHQAAEAKIVAAARQFWDDVAHGREPGPDYGKDADLLPIIAPLAVKDKTIDLSASNELPALLDQRARLKEQIQAYAARCEEIETEVRFRMKDAERVVGIDGFSITYKNQHRDAYTIPAKDYRVLRINKKEA